MISRTTRNLIRIFITVVQVQALNGQKLDDSSESSEEGSNCRKLPPNPKRTAIIGDGKLDIADFLNGGALDMISEVPPEIILVLGNTGCGKTTLTQIIAGNLSRLHAVHTHTGQLVIVDDDERIGAPSTVSRTLVPELVNMTQNNVTTYFYDCPGFDDTRWPEQDLAANYFMNSIVRNATKLKMLFLVTHSSVAHGNDRLDFDLLVRHATKFIRNLTQFENSIGLVVTKVNSFSIQNGNPVKYKKLLKQVVEFLTVYNQTLQKQLSEEKDADNIDVILRKIQFVDILMKPNKEGEISRIVLSRNPKICGPLINSEFVADTKLVATQLYNGLEYSHLGNESNFGYTLKDKTVINIQKYTRDINLAIKKKVNETVEHFKEWFDQNSFKGNESDPLEISSLIQQSCVDIENMQRNLPAFPSQFIAKLKVSLERMGYTMPPEVEKFMANQDRILNFFDEVTGIQVDRSLSDWSIPILEFHWVLAEYRDWYSFCVQVKSRVETYDFHLKKSSLPTTQSDTDWLEFLEAHGVYKVEGHLKSIYQKFRASDEGGLKHVNILNDIMTWGMQPANIRCQNETRVIATGNFVRLSEFVDAGGNLNKTCPNILTVEVFAADTIFMDANIYAVGKELVVVMTAPKWRVVGNVHFNLNGADALDIEPRKASDAVALSDPGTSGVAGKPGGPGGIFMGIVKKIKDASKLTISANGGSGGRGQDGGNGGMGDRGGTSKLRSQTSYFPGVWSKEKRGIKGEPGKPGGDGGWGGIGGYGGNPGNVTIISYGGQGDKGINVLKLKGLEGIPGEGGLGGKGGAGSYDDYCHDKDLLLGISWTNECFQFKNPDGRRGYDGEDGGSMVNWEEPRSVSYRVDVNSVRGVYRSMYERSSSKETVEFLNWWDRKWIKGLLG